MLKLCGYKNVTTFIGENCFDIKLAQIGIPEEAQEAQSWLQKRWDAFCKLLRKIWKKEKEEILPLSNEQAMIIEETEE